MGCSPVNRLGGDDEFLMQVGGCPDILGFAVGLDLAKQKQKDLQMAGRRMAARKAVMMA